MTPADSIRVEVAYAEPARQTLLALELPAGTTAAEALACSGLAARLGLDPQRCALGVFGSRVAPGTVLRDGDRVEVYRPLPADPKEARRARARRGVA